MPADPDTSSRRIPPGDFAGDDGSADPTLARACALPDGDPERRPRVLAALHRARVLAPVIALATEVETTPDGLLQDRRADIAVPLLLDDQDQRALPVFTDLTALARWDPTARPVPVAGVRAAHVALAEGAQALVLDVAGPCPVTVELPELNALVTGRGSVLAWEDPDLADELASLLEGFPAARSAALTPRSGRDARLEVTVLVRASDVSTLTALAARLTRGVRDLPSAHWRVRGLDVVLRITERTGR